MSSSLRIRVFLGGRDNKNGNYLKAALSSTPGRIYNVDELDVDRVKSKKFSPQDIVDWLLDSDIHFILGHLHQGIISPHVGLTETTVKWNADDMKKQLLRLSTHPGFPSGDNLSCPIFLQVTFSYIYKHIV